MAPLGIEGGSQDAEAELDMVFALRLLGIQPGALGFVLFTIGSLSSPSPPLVMTLTIIWGAGAQTYTSIGSNCKVNLASISTRLPWEG